MEGGCIKGVKRGWKMIGGEGGWRKEDGGKRRVERIGCRVVWMRRNVKKLLGKEESGVGVSGRKWKSEWKSEWK